MAKHKILPFFIPMEGCPQRCIYCDQYAIAGETASPSAAQIASALERFTPDAGAEVAFYGGSFTCLPRERQRYLLQAVQPALLEGRIGGIRISTRPDALDAELLNWLGGQGVRTVELGIQSFDADVLAKSARGYTPEIAEQACRLVSESGLRLGVQLMTGLPADDAFKDRQSVRGAAELGASLLRIYPTLVLRGTRLAEDYSRGAYRPQSLEEAIRCCAAMMIMAEAQKLNIIRIGINPTPEVEAALIAGPYHPAFGGLVKEAVKMAQIRDLLASYDSGRAAALLFPPAEQALIWGQKAAGLQALARDYPNLALIPDRHLRPGDLSLELEGQSTLSTLHAFCQRQIRGSRRPC
ncbi:MAG: radical SAM protein [Clostridia bacterium]|nr:radical SAM protein [Clostridia bacterium]